MAEDGSLPDRYELRETPSRKYAQRTEWNVRDSDATVVFSIAAEPQGGTRLTLELAERLGKPVLHLSREVLTPEIAATKLREFLERACRAYAQCRRASCLAGTRDCGVRNRRSRARAADVVCRAAVLSEIGKRDLLFPATPACYCYCDESSRVHTRYRQHESWHSKSPPKKPASAGSAPA